MADISKYILLIVVLLSCELSYGCTTILIGKHATKDGSVILAHNEDMGREAAGVVKHYPSQSFPQPNWISVPYVKLKQTSGTYGYWASGNARNVSGLGNSSNTPYDYNHILIGMNEHGVAMACNWMNSKEENSEGKGIRRYAIRQLILERAKTSREAVDIITDFIDQYGQADWSGLTYCVADSAEAWIVETTTFHWVARRIRDNEILTVANRFTITSDYDLSSDDLVEFALRKTWVSTYSARLNFREVYGKMPENEQDYDIERENLVKSILEPHRGKIDERQLMKLLKHRYQSATNFKPILDECWREYCEENSISRPLSSCLTQSSSIAVLHSKYKDVGGKMWYSIASPHAGIYFPLYGKLSTIHTGISNDDGNDNNSIWWKFRSLQENVDQHYISKFSGFEKRQDKIQNDILKENEAFEKLNSRDISDWSVHQLKLSKMVLQILTEQEH